MSAARILVIEDNSADVLLLRHALDQQGKPYELSVLEDGAAALGFVDSQRAERSEEPCIIILDLHLPRHSGIEVLRAIRVDPILIHVHVVVLTTVARPAEETEAGKLGAYFKLKPSDLRGFDELAVFILELCEQDVRT